MPQSLLRTKMSSKAQVGYGGGGTIMIEGINEDMNSAFAKCKSGLNFTAAGVGSLTKNKTTPSQPISEDHLTPIRDEANGSGIDEEMAHDTKPDLVMDQEVTIGNDTLAEGEHSQHLSMTHRLDHERIAKSKSKN